MCAFWVLPRVPLLLAVALEVRRDGDAAARSSDSGPLALLEFPWFDGYRITSSFLCQHKAMCIPSTSLFDDIVNDSQEIMN